VCVEASYAAEEAGLMQGDGSDEIVQDFAAK
jgi:hypothetical protein